MPFFILHLSYSIMTKSVFVKNLLTEIGDILYILSMTSEEEIMEITKLIGQRIIEARERLGWNQSELARQVKKPRQQLSQIEQGKQQPRAELLVELATKLGVTTDYLLGRKAA